MLLAAHDADEGMIWVRAEEGGNVAAFGKSVSNRLLLPCTPRFSEWPTPYYACINSIRLMYHLTRIDTLE